MVWEAVINGREVGHGYDSTSNSKRLNPPPPPGDQIKLTTHRRTMARQHRTAQHVSPPTPKDALRHPHRPPQHISPKRRNMPRPAQGRVDAGLQRSRVRSRRQNAPQLP